MNSEPKAPRRLVRSSFAVLAGVVVIVVLSVGTDRALQAMGVFPSFATPYLFTTSLLLLATVYRSLYSIAGSYLTARLAPSHPMRHALVLGGVGVVTSSAGAVAMRGVGPVWYPLALVALALPCAWAGGRLHALRGARTQG